METTCSFIDGNTLYECINNKIDVDRILAHIEKMNQWHRYTGTPDGEAFVDDLIRRLDEYDIPYEIETYQAYASIPVKSSLTLSNGDDVRTIADVYSADTTDDLYGQIIYDHWSENNNNTPEETAIRYAAFKNKIVLSHSSGGEFANEVARYGGLALLHINKSKGGYIHHSNISPVWGTPCINQMHMLCVLPSVGISLEDGDKLINMLDQQDVYATLNVKMNTRIVTTRMPIVNIQGNSDKFVLLHGHYDSWYEGITDNAASDAILLELARAFYANRDSLKRSIRIAWWSGHSDARYAGSTWYCDTHWDELNKKCVASINLDLTGCKCANQIRARTACMEGESFTANLIKEFTGVDAKAYIPMIRGADQSFWGVHIPIHIMFKYEPTDETRVSPCPSGGPWWHTDQDTLDKLDVNILLRDLRINAKAVCLITNSGALPVNLIEFIDKVEKCLISIQKETPDGFGMQDVLASIGNVKSACTILVECIKDNPSTDYDAFLKLVAGELVRLVYSAGSMYQQDLSSPYQPFGIIASSVKTAKNMHGTVLALCAKTEFIRACNRIKGQCDAIQKMIKCYMTMA